MGPGRTTNENPTVNRKSIFIVGMDRKVFLEQLSELISDKSLSKLSRADNMLDQQCQVSPGSGREM
jgi:hypothetical protein